MDQWLKTHLTLLWLKLRPELVLLWTDVDTFAKKIWASNKWLFAVLIPVLGLLYGRSFLMSLIVKQAKQTINSAEKQDAKLTQAENTANAQANSLIKQAEAPSTDTPVDDNWYKNQK